MTRNKDANLLAEAYKNILNENAVLEFINSLDPETLNTISHMLAIGGGLTLAALHQRVEDAKNKKGEQQDLKASSTATPLNSQGQPANPNEFSNTHVSASLQQAKDELNKGKTRI